MAKAVIAYDKDLPEIPGRRLWGKPSSYFVKVGKDQWRIEETERCPGQLLLVPRIHAAVDAWRQGGYEGASRTRGSCCPARLSRPVSSEPTTTKER